MNISELFELQKKLDEHIIKNHNLEGRSLLNERLLALEVEIGELANEIRCFKFWSNKKSSKKEVILEEYVDCLHFILSIGLECNFENNKFKSSTNYEDNLSMTEQFLNLHINIANFITHQTKYNYIKLFENFLTLGTSIGFSGDDIERAYYEKNNINHERQISGY